MKNLQEATEKICELKGSLVALDALVIVGSPKPRRWKRPLPWVTPS